MKFTCIIISFLLLMTFNSKGQHTLCKLTDSSYKGVGDFFKRVGLIEERKYINQGYWLYDELKNILPVLSKGEHFESLDKTINELLSRRSIVGPHHIVLVEQYIKTAIKGGGQQEKIEKLERIKEKLVPYIKQWRETKDAPVSIAIIKNTHTMLALLNTVKAIAPIVNARCLALLNVIES